MSNIYNFGAGPSMLPRSVLENIQTEFLDWQQTGMSILEIGHRSPEFLNLMSQVETLLRRLLNIPEHYQIFFLGSPTRVHFSMIPMNLLQEGKKGGYWITGYWSNMAYKEASRLGATYCIASEQDSGFVRLPERQSWEIQEESAYLYCTSNETINGVRFDPLPLPAKDIPLVADMTSSLLTEPIDISQYDLIFAGVQKNIANAGLSIVIANPAVFAHEAMRPLPSLLDYRQHRFDKMLATPPTFNCYLMGKVLEWLLEQGGVEAIYKQNCQKSDALYDYIDQSGFYTCHVAKKARSLVNVCFNLPDETMENAFLEMAQKRGLLALKGHRAQGGLRASLYNAMPLSGVNALLEMMEDFVHKQS